MVFPFLDPFQPVYTDLTTSGIRFRTVTPPVILKFQKIPKTKEVK